MGSYTLNGHQRELIATFTNPRDGDLYGVYESQDYIYPYVFPLHLVNLTYCAKTYGDDFHMED